jgi:hypothetical protein
MQITPTTQTMPMILIASGETDVIRVRSNEKQQDTV